MILLTLASATGAILFTLVDTMIPETFSVAHDFAELMNVVGLLVTFVLRKIGG